MGRPLILRCESNLPSKQRVVLHHLVHLGADGGNLCLGSRLGGRVDGTDDVVNHVDDERHLVFLQATGGNGRCTDAQTRGQERRAAVEGHHVLVDGDACAHEGLLSHLAGQLGEFG